jgi:hypothetical protein
MLQWDQALMYSAKAWANPVSSHHSSAHHMAIPVKIFRTNPSSTNGISTPFGTVTDSNRDVEKAHQLFHVKY